MIAYADSVLCNAYEAVYSARMADYGPPIENHERTAALWTIYLRATLRDKVSLSARDVCMLNILQKVSRDVHRPKRDNLVDIAGYAENASLCENPRGRDALAETRGREDGS